MIRDWTRAHDAARELAKVSANLLDLTENCAFFQANGSLEQADIEEVRQATADATSWAIEIAQSLKEARV